MSGDLDCPSRFRFADGILDAGIPDLACVWGQFLGIRQLFFPSRVLATKLEQPSDIVRVWEVNFSKNEIGLQVLLGALLGVVGNQPVGTRLAWIPT